MCYVSGNTYLFVDGWRTVNSVSSRICQIPKKMSAASRKILRFVGNDYDRFKFNLIEDGLKMGLNTDIFDTIVGKFCFISMICQSCGHLSLSHDYHPLFSICKCPDSDICLFQAIFCWVALARKILMSLPEEFETAFF